MNMREFCFRDKAGLYIEDMDEAIHYSVEEIKKCHQFRQVEFFI